MKPRFRWRYEGWVIARKLSWFWIGVSWRRSVDLSRIDTPVLFALYICPLPCVLICLRFRREKRS